MTPALPSDQPPALPFALRNAELRDVGAIVQLIRDLADFEQLPIKPEVRQKIMLDNAVKLFGLEDRVGASQAGSDSG